MEIEKSKVLIKFLLNFRQSGDVLFFLNVRRLRGYTATKGILQSHLIFGFLQGSVQPCHRHLLFRASSVNSDP